MHANGKDLRVVRQVNRPTFTLRDRELLESMRVFSVLNPGEQRYVVVTYKIIAFHLFYELIKYD